MLAAPFMRVAGCALPVFLLLSLPTLHQTLQVERLQSELAAARDSLREAQGAARTAAADSQRFKEQVRAA